MAKLKSEGTALAVSISGVFVPVSQVLSMEKDDMASETYESDTLDNTLADILYDSTGRTEPGSFNFELFLDPKLSVHCSLLDLLVTPKKTNYQLTFANADPTATPAVAATVWPFTGAGFSLAGPKIALKDGVKASCKIKLAQLPIFAS